MALKPHATTEEQRAELGKIRRKPVQVDMFTGELVVKPPKRGNGSHIALKACGIEKPVIPGMMSHAGEGPYGKYCWDCQHYGEVAVLRPDDNETVEMNRTGCALWARRMGHAAPSPSRDIGPENACKYFSDAGRASRRFVILTDGETVSVDQFAKNLRKWAAERRG